MAEVIDFDFSQTRRGRLKYPWREWMDGQTRRIVQGTDFAHAVETMRAQIHVHARRNGMRAKVTRDTPTSLIFKMAAKS